jgi:hypothetical protein
LRRAASGAAKARTPRGVRLRGESVSLEITGLYVLNHVTSVALHEIIDTFHATLEAGGLCLIALPVVSPRYIVDPDAADWDGRSDSAGGIGAMFLLAQKVGLIQEIDHKLHLLQRHLPYHESDHVLNIAFNLLAVGLCMK